ncbi:hypothetical protein WMY93_031689 [Mugilogobius chulae]|uniref:Uncharacterized protein n=1 Tax=Mugilogobius chulae TaxID=88201 RepID=A0AAW0MFE9_9GOBI
MSERRETQKLQQNGQCVIHHADGFIPVRAEDGHSFSVVNLLRGQTSANITERSPLLRFPQDDSLTYMTVHDPGFADEHWDQTLDFRARFRLGSEVTSLSLSRSCSSGDKNENLDRNFKFAHNIRCCMKVSKTVCIFTLVVLCSLFFSMYPDRDNPWRMLAVSPTESFCILHETFTFLKTLDVTCTGTFVSQTVVHVPLLVPEDI